MKKRIKNIFRVLFLLCFFSALAQEPAFYIRSLRSIHLNNTPNVLQPVSFRDVDVVYNKIGQFLNNKITVSAPGTYEISGFANINPGVMGNGIKDSIQMQLLLIKNPQQPTETEISKTEFTFTYGNFDVASGLHIAPQKIILHAGDEISMWVKILPSSTIEINKSSKYDHINKPTGMEQIAGIRIAKVLE